MMTLNTVFAEGVDVILRSVEIGRSLSPRSNNNISNPDTGLCAQGIIAGIIATVPDRDNRWVALVQGRLGVSEGLFEDYLAHGDSVLLANWVHIIPPFFHLSLEDDHNTSSFLLLILECISKFDIQNTLPGLQHVFCTLWNEIVLEARKSELSPFPFNILRPIRHFYITLHQGTDAAPTAFDASTVHRDPILLNTSSYPFCNIPGHHTHINNAAPTGKNTHPPTIASPTVLPSHRSQHHHTFHSARRVIFS
jgi:hypothetical protein